MEKNLREARNKYEKLLTQCANLTAAMDLMGRTKTTVVRRPQNIVRPIRGGSFRGDPNNLDGMASPDAESSKAADGMSMDDGVSGA